MDLVVVLVVVPLVDCLCLLEAVAHVGQELIPLGHAPSHGCDARVARFIGPDGRWVVAVDDPERHIIEGSLEGCVVVVLRPR